MFFIYACWNCLLTIKSMKFTTEGTQHMYIFIVQLTNSPLQSTKIHHYHISMYTSALTQCLFPVSSCGCHQQRAGSSKSVAHLRQYFKVFIYNCVFNSSLQTHIPTNQFIAFTFLIFNYNKRLDLLAWHQSASKILFILSSKYYS